MKAEEFQKRIEDNFTAAEVELSGEGCNFGVTIISPDFAGKMTLARHKMVYALVDEEIKSGTIHALTIRAYTPEEAAKV